MFGLYFVIVLPLDYSEKKLLFLIRASRFFKTPCWYKKLKLVIQLLLVCSDLQRLPLREY